MKAEKENCAKISCANRPAGVKVLVMERWDKVARGIMKFKVELHTA